LGQVARHLGEAAQLALRVAQGVEDDVGPEARAVLAHAPALVLEAPHRGGGLQALLRFAALRVFGRVEAREVLADDLRRLVALDALGAGVPGQDDAVRVEQVNGVVADALYQGFEMVLALKQLFMTRAIWIRVWAHVGSTPVTLADEKYNHCN